MFRRQFLLAPAAFALSSLAAAPARAEQLSLNQISAYLNGLETVKAEFTQINADATISTGTIYIRRPGRARFEYNPPAEALVIVGGSQVGIFDNKSNTGPEQYPLSRTPLNLILGRDIDLGTAGMVTGHSFDGTATTVRAQDPENPEYGYIEMMFTGPPVELRQWVITDGAGDKTTVILGKLDQVETLSNTMFSITVEQNRRQRARND